MASNLVNQIKARLQPFGSPKLKLSSQSPTITNIQRVTNGKVSQRDRNTSGSPDDQTSSRGNVIQRIQMKNVAFIPAKGQSPISQNLQLQQCTPNLTNMNNNDQHSKVSPQRFIQGGNKMVIPANQIKLVKKDGTSPSPEARIPQKLSPTNIQNQNPNISMGFNPLKNKVPRPNVKIMQQSKDSDDETTVMSDSEDKVQNLNSLKSDTNQNNFNRPKLTQGSQQAQDPKTLRSQDQQQRFKVISTHKIRQSPSPPPNQVLKLQQPPTVTNIQVQMKQQQQQQQQQQTSQPQLATDFIKGMINQSRTNNMQSNGSTQKKIGISNCLKIKNAQQQNFDKDMKKHGLVKDIQDVNQLNQILTENSPVRVDESQMQAQQPPKVLQNQRNYSPPPNFTQVSGQSPSNVSNCEENQASQQQEGEKNVFQFPFQRRARSLSLPKQEIVIQNKMGQKGPQQQSPQQHPHQQQTKSPSPHNEESRRNKPVVAKINFVIAQKGAMGKNYKSPHDETVFERNKEVDEWLMGSGESDATAGSTTSNLQLLKVKAKQSELEKPIQPIKHNEMDDNSMDGDDDEDWMFKTFNAKKAGQQKEGKNPQPPGRSRIIDQQDELAEFEESPFDMAPELSKQFSKNPKQNNFMFDNMVEECQDLSQYIDQIDQFMMDKRY